MAGKGGKGLLAGKTTAANKDKDKKKPVSRSSRAGLQVNVITLFIPYASFPSALAGIPFDLFGLSIYLDILLKILVAWNQNYYYGEFFFFLFFPIDIIGFVHKIISMIWVSKLDCQGKTLKKLEVLYVKGNGSPVIEP
uniref:Uncharacterized protein n=1 Tax=Nelumbo nucifera TaxID=4432 RepID=A0A822YVC9_NELNU|nr:TPA_asm: hypothetical protein HUJ06_007273 [Nelumbo nucifera]